MEDKNSKRIEKKLQFGDLPPRVIIHDIISFYNLVVMRELIQSEGEFLLFGYFTRDRARNIWFVFSSVNFSYIASSCLHENIVRVDLKKLYSLGMYPKENCLKVLEPLVSHTKKMYSLRSLWIGLESSNSLFDTSFFRKMEFPHLKSFEISTLSVDETPTFEQFGAKQDAVNFPPSLEHLAVQMFKNSESGKMILFRKVEERLSNLKMLFLENFASAFPVTLFLPKLICTELEGVENIIVVAGRELQSLRIWGEENKELLRNLVKESQKIKILNISILNSQSPEFKFIFDSSCNQLANLSQFFFVVHDDSFRFTEKEVEYLFKLKDQLIEMNIFQANFEYDIFNQREFKSLKELTVSFSKPIESNSDHIWPISKNLRKLRLISATFSDLTDSDILFTKNEFLLLEELQLDVVFLATGKGWNRLPNLVEFHINVAFWFSNSFFEEHDELNKFRVLKVKLCHSLTGNNWSEVIFKNLEHFELYSCGGFNDKFFQENQFLNLKSLKLFEMEKLTGKNWKKMSSLESLEVEKCPNFEENHRFN